MKPSKKRLKTAAGSSAVQDAARVDGSGVGKGMPIELLDSFKSLRKSWPKDMARLLDPSLPDGRRSELWEIMCEGGDDLRKRFAWAIPDERALRIITHFGPIVEVGSGLGYWAMLLRSRGADITAYDKAAGAPDASGKPRSSKKKGASMDMDHEHEDGDGTPSFWIKVDEGGPDVLEEPCNEKRSLLLCYPDDFEGETESLGLRCLHAYEGDVVIHVGELFGDSVSMRPGQSPWGRTTSQECQEELASKFHCILKVPLPSWPHARDTLTVWKRHSFCAIQYDDDSEEEDGSVDDQEVAERTRQGGAEDNEDGCAPGGGHGEESASASASAKNSKEESERTKKDDSDINGRSHLSGSESDETGSVEGLPIGMPDVDMFAFVPADEQLPCTQAAPCVSFLLNTPS